MDTYDRCLDCGKETVTSSVPEVCTECRESDLADYYYDLDRDLEREIEEDWTKE